MKSKRPLAFYAVLDKTTNENLIKIKKNMVLNEGLQWGTQKPTQKNLDSGKAVTKSAD